MEPSITLDAIRLDHRTDRDGLAHLERIEITMALNTDRIPPTFEARPAWLAGAAIGLRPHPRIGEHRYQVDLAVTLTQEEIAALLALKAAIEARVRAAIYPTTVEETE